MRPLAAKTVGDPRKGPPRSADAFCEALEYTACVIPFRSVHLKTSWSSGLSGVCLEGRFDIDDRLETEKPDVAGRE
jgi:hypothetical protein